MRVQRCVRAQGSRHTPPTDDKQQRRRREEHEDGRLCRPVQPLLQQLHSWPRLRDGLRAGLRSPRAVSGQGRFSPRRLTRQLVDARQSCSTRRSRPSAVARPSRMRSRTETRNRQASRRQLSHCDRRVGRTARQCLSLLRNGLSRDDVRAQQGSRRQVSPSSAFRKRPSAGLMRSTSSKPIDTDAPSTSSGLSSTPTVARSWW